MLPYITSKCMHVCIYVCMYEFKYMTFKIRKIQSLFTRVDENKNLKVEMLTKTKFYQCFFFSLLFTMSM